MSAQCNVIKLVVILKGAYREIFMRQIEIFQDIMRVDVLVLCGMIKGHSVYMSGSFCTVIVL